MFDWNDLRYFLAVVRHGSTLAAARALKVNQSTVYRRLTELEKRTGHLLFHRRATGYRLTGLGEELRPYAEAVEAAVRALERQVAALDKQLTGTIRLTCPEPLVYRIGGSSLIERFHARYSGLGIEYLMSDRFMDLSRGEADVAIRAGNLPDSALVCRKLSESPWGVYASDSYIARHGAPAELAGIGQHAVIGFDGPLNDHRAARWLREIAPGARVGARNDSIPGLLFAVKSGMGLAPLPMALGDAEPSLIPIFGPIPDLATNWYLITHPDVLKTARVRAFFDFVVDEIDAVRAILLGEAPAGRP